jgi:hypothetical protein
MLQESLKAPINEALVTLSTQSMTPEAEFLLADTLAFLINNNIVPSCLEAVASNNHRIITKTIEQATRIMFVNTLGTKLPENLRQLLPSSEPESPSFTDSADILNTEEYQRMKQVVRIKDGSEAEVVQVLKESGNMKMFIMSLIENGSRTITHFLKLLELYSVIVGNSNEGRKLLVDLLFEYWSGADHSAKLERYLQISLKQSIVDATYVADKVDISNEDSLTSYRLVEILMDVSPTSVAPVLLNKANDSMTKWMVKTWPHVIKGATNVELLNLFE